jgi:hypothetical protein
MRTDRDGPRLRWLTNVLTRPSASRRDRGVRAGIRQTATFWLGASQRTCGYAGDVSGAVAGLMSDLPLALRALGSDAVVTEDGPQPLAEWEPSPPRVSDVGLAGRPPARQRHHGHPGTGLTLCSRRNRSS